MGGGYYERPTRTRADDLNDKISNFFSTKNAKQRLEILREAHEFAEYHNESAIDAVWSAVNMMPSRAKFENPLQGIEIELKLTAMPTKKGLESALNSYSMDNNRFLRSSVTQTEEATVTYFGSDTAELFSVKESGSKSRIKIKGQPAPRYEFGLECEEYVMKRLEKFSHPDNALTSGILPIVQTVVQLTGNSHIKEMGTMNKEVAIQRVLEAETGRLYSLALSRCTAKSISQLFQLELEYLGQFTHFPIPKPFSEKDIVADILDLAKNFQKSSKLEMTLQTKYDWLIGKNSEPAKDSQAESEPILGQEFFGKAFG